MGNVIGEIPMSNGLTDVFINVLVLSGSRLARSDSEKQLVVWLAERDQSRVGMGAVGFDIGEMPWDSERFDEYKAFLLNTIRGAERRLGWETLDYSPNENMIFPVLKKFYESVNAFGAEDIVPGVLDEWLASAEDHDPVRRGFPECEKHGILLSCFGCQVCNN